MGEIECIQCGKPAEQLYSPRHRAIVCQGCGGEMRIEEIRRIVTDYGTILALAERLAKCK